MKRPNLPIGIRIARWIRKAGRFALGVSTVCFLISLTEPNFWLSASLAAAAVLAILIELGGLEIGQVLADREFAAAVAADSVADRRIILFLRSFDIARSSLGSKFFKQLFTVGQLALFQLAHSGEFVPHRPYGVEENLDNAIGPNAMFVAVGDRVASYGAAKITVKDEDWQSTFHRLANASHLIFMMPGPSQGALWELGQIRWSRSLLAKTIFIMPPEQFSPFRESSLRWAELKEMAAELGVGFPPYSREGCYFRLRDDGQPTEIVALEPFTRALGKFVASPAYAGVIDFAEVLKLV
jgi:hypothetical protein